MPLCTLSDEKTLHSIDFVNHYNHGNNRAHYRLEGKYVHIVASYASKQTGVVLEPGDLVDALSARLRACPLFIKLMRRKRPWASPLIYDLWATPVARYMLDEDWVEFI